MQPTFAGQSRSVPSGNAFKLKTGPGTANRRPIKAKKLLHPVKELVERLTDEDERVSLTALRVGQHLKGRIISIVQ